MMNITPQIIDPDLFVQTTEVLAAILATAPAVRLMFRKRNGDFRIMMATRREMGPYRASADKKGLVCQVVEIPTGKYRSFRWDRLIAFEVQS